MRSNNLFWGAVLILVGFVFLADNLGLLGNINIWGILWPLVLIAFGAYTLWGTVFRKAPAIEQVAVPLEGASRANVKVNHGAGRLRVGAGAGAGDLLQGQFGGGVEVDRQQSGDRLDLRLRLPAQFFPMWGPGFSLDWNIDLNPEVPLELDFETGANEARLDLSELRVSSLRLKSGASSTQVTLPAHAGSTRAEFESGAASLEIQVPEGVAARIHWRGGLSSINVNQARFQPVGDTYQSPDFESAQNRADIEVQMGVGSVSVH